MGKLSISTHLPFFSPAPPYFAINLYREGLRENGEHGVGENRYLIHFSTASLLFLPPFSSFLCHLCVVVHTISQHDLFVKTPHFPPFLVISLHPPPGCSISPPFFSRLFGDLASFGFRHRGAVLPCVIPQASTNALSGCRPRLLVYQSRLRAHSLKCPVAIAPLAHCVAGGLQLPAALCHLRLPKLLGQGHVHSHG